MDAISALSSSSNIPRSLEDFPMASGGLYTLADILTSINKKQSLQTPTVFRKKTQEDPDSLEWKEYQAKRLQALKILKQEKERRMKEEMKRLGLKAVTPDLRSRLEAQFQYLHDALLPDSGLEEEQAAAAKAERVGRKKSKNRTSVHWSQDVLEKEKKKLKSKSSTSTTTKSSSKSKKSLNKKVTPSLLAKASISLTDSKTSSKQLSITKSKLLKKSASLTSKGGKKSKRVGKATKEKSLENEIKRLEVIEKGAKNLLQELDGQFGSLDKTSPSTDINKFTDKSKPLNNGVLADLELDKIKSKLSAAPKLKTPSQANKASVPKKPRSNSLGRLRGSKPIVQSSGYGPKYLTKRTENLKRSSTNSIKKTGKANSDNKNTGIFKKAAAQQNAITGMKQVMDMKIPKLVVRSKSVVENAPKLKAVPLIGGIGRTMVIRPVNAAKSKSVSVPGPMATKSTVPGNAVGVNKNKNLGGSPSNSQKASVDSKIDLKAMKSKSMDIPPHKSTVIAELYSVNSRIAAGVDSFIEKGSKKEDLQSNSKSSTIENPESESKQSQKGQQSSLYVRPAQRKPPKFPTVDLCNVFPGTQEWDVYWEKFNGQITNYYAEMDEYLKSMNDFTMDLEDYSKELKKIQVGNQAFAMKLGLNPNYKNGASSSPKVPPTAAFQNTPLEPGIYNINGYIIKSGGGRIPGLRLTTVGDEGFNLELDLAEIDIDPQLITVETEFNVMTITVPVKTELGRVRIIQIRVPSRSNVNDLSLREVQRSTKKGVKSRVLLITGN